MFTLVKKILEKYTKSPPRPRTSRCLHPPPPPPQSPQSYAFKSRKFSFTVNKPLTSLVNVQSYVNILIPFSPFQQ